MTTSKTANKQSNKHTSKHIYKHKDWGNKGSSHPQDPTNRLNPLAQELSVTVHDVMLLQIISGNSHNRISATYIQYPM